MSKPDPIKRNAEATDRYLASRIKGEPRLLYGAAAHLIKHGGKRLRPFMVVKSCQLLGGHTSSAMPVVGAVEMIHNFTLVHDDIMDNDDMRHGVPTVHKKYGEPLAILAGDVLFSKAFQAVSGSSLGPERTANLLSRLSDACVKICEGQVLDIVMAERKGIPTRKQYIEMVSKKTAALFDVSCAMGAICADGTPKDISNLSSFGKNLGIAFQIIDDLMGVMGDPQITKKPVGNDLREGKKSLPIVAAISRAKGRDRQHIMRCFGRPKAGKKDLQQAVAAIRSMGIEEYARGQAATYARRAQGSLDCYDGQAKQDLTSLLDFVVRRTA